jgi:hypothetical protein
MKRPLLIGLVLAVVLSAMPLAALASPAAASATPSGSQCVYHWVKPGETLSGIAARYGVNMWTLAQRNGISNPNRIYAGQRLLIYCTTPKPPPPPPHPKPPHPYPPPQPPQPYPPGPCTPPGCGPYVPPPAQPGDGASACSIPPQNGFGTVWYRNASVRQRLGCPTTAEQGFSGTQQFFHNGFAVANDTSGLIYVFYNNGTWQQFQNTWTSGDPVFNPSLYPPPGWCQPEYGIGKVWRNQDNVSQKLGWARHPAQPTNGTTQQYQGGMMLWTPSAGVYVMYNNGTFQHFN